MTTGRTAGETALKDKEAELGTVEKKGMAGDPAMREAVRTLLGKVEQAGDEENARKLKQLLAKAESGRLYLAFCGHFSAGKSSLINRLCGHQLLPSSPIPTSANIVSIVSGEAGARVIYREPGEGGSPKVDRVALEDLAEHCRNGTDIETVEIAYPIPLLGEAAALLDTPGIDSTDDAHHLATESALHLADVVFYVMDYNHVQSEINLSFTKKMTEWGKPLYLIINMVDKHREQEVSLEAYRDGVRDAFASWGVRPDGIVYTSVKVPDHPASQWNRLDWLLRELITLREPLVNLSLEKSAKALAGAHAAKMAEANEPAKDAIRAQLEEGGVDITAAQAELERLAAELARLEEMPRMLDAALRKDVAAVLDNANITPAVTRDLAHAYLESRRPGFKVGWFGSAAKTQAEREARLSALHKDFASQLETQVERHVQQAVKSRLEGQGLPLAQVTEVADRIHAEVTPAWLAAQVNEAASFGGEYTLTYSKGISAEAKALYRQAALAAGEELIAQLDAALQEPRAVLRGQLAELQARLGGLRELDALAAAEAAYGAALLAPLPAAAAPALPAPASAPGAAEGTAPQAAAPAGQTPSEGLALGLQRAGRGAAPAGGAALGAEAHRAQLRQAAERLRAAAGELDGTAALASIRRSLLDKAERLGQSRFTIALFGAFSAGKSSFANALIGQRVLPVSPNPTTAAINKIMPPAPEAGWPHGTAKVRMKSRERLLDDVVYSLGVLGIHAEGEKAALEAAKGLQPAQIPGKGKPHYAFLKAVEKGWSEMSPKLGEELKVSSDEFGAYAAEESRSCFVEEIELYYNNPLTEQGVVLVDTPGADSINARHTGVAFEYIKNADAILFVTYYNHAFSHADREFLLQLGRVKDSFELDKMFFIVNAADLASSPEELEGVVSHVESNLLQHGIRHPRIYPLSSYYALQGKLAGDAEAVEETGILRFEREFVRFTFGELTEMAVRAGDAEVKRAADVLSYFMERATADASEREREAAQLRESLSGALRKLESPELEAEQRELAKDVAELLYYVKQRTTYRFGELFNHAINPAVFREDNRDPKAILVSAWEDLRRMITFDLTQEVLATTLRIGNKVNALLKGAEQAWAEEVRRGGIDSFEASEFRAMELKTPELTAQLKVEITAKWLGGFFKNAKQFFEGEGKAQLRKELEALLVAPMTAFAEEQTQTLQAVYAAQLQEGAAERAEAMRQALQEHAGGLLEALEAKVDLPALRAKHTRLLQCLEPQKSKA
ncbi:dynamin family protein [Paenibacillus mucilaginosus]|uniref:dynamin family protein n=3 Tax=Paenibacillus mucilaginosus TaxID=61624 RepID=UPI0023780D4C|nr:dynamin family protein [Paenibacillus mucilaginosus]WDM30422.1 dynamin family protein [Paenibacillus mucilaginosus]